MTATTLSEAEPLPRVAPPTAKSGGAGALLRRALREPRPAITYALAILRARFYLAWYRARGVRVTAGARFRVFGRLDVRGPGVVAFGDNVAVWGHVTPWTYSREARILVGDDSMLSGTRFGCMREIRVGKRCILSDARIMDTDFHSTRADRHDPRAPIRVAPVRLEDNVWVAAQAALLPGTSVGENSVVGFGSVLLRDYPANKVIVGNPGKVAMPIEAAGEETLP